MARYPSGQPSACRGPPSRPAPQGVRNRSSHSLPARPRFSPGLRPNVAAGSRSTRRRQHWTGPTSGRGRFSLDWLARGGLSVWRGAATRRSWQDGGWAPPSGRRSVSIWGQPYHTGFQSAAFELGLTPDRPGAVQACVPLGAKRPRAWKDIPIQLVYLRTFTLDGKETRTLDGFPIVIASVEKLLIDAAALPARIGGVFGLARIVDRALESADWARVADLAKNSSRGQGCLTTTCSDRRAP